MVISLTVWERELLHMGINTQHVHVFGTCTEQQAAAAQGVVVEQAPSMDPRASGRCPGGNIGRIRDRAVECLDGDGQPGSTSGSSNGVLFSVMVVEVKRRILTAVSPSMGKRPRRSEWRCGRMTSSASPKLTMTKPVLT